MSRCRTVPSWRARPAQPALLESHRSRNIAGSGEVHGRPRSLASLERRGQVAGTVDGGVAASISVQTALVFFSPEAQIQSTSLDGRYVLPVSWSGPLFITGAVHALQIARPVRGAFPTSYPGYGVTTGVQVFAEGTTPAVDVFLDLRR